MLDPEFYTKFEKVFRLVKAQAFTSIDPAVTLQFVSKECQETYGDDRTVSTGRHFEMSGYRIMEDCKQYIENVFPGKTITPRAHLYYPPGGYMGWHTNSNFPGDRIYVVWSDGKSFFRSIVNGEIVTKYDPPGWSISQFTIPGDGEPLWHCVYSEGDRYSMGFAIT